MILLSNDMFDYIVRLLGSAVEGGTKVLEHPVQGSFAQQKLNKDYNN